MLMRPASALAFIVVIIAAVVGCCFIPGSVTLPWRSAWADPLANAVPAVNTPLVGCVEGRALRIVNGAPACSPGVTPTLSGCTGGTIDAASTDFIGQVTLPAGITSCTVVMSKLYASPPLICIAQTQGAMALSLGNPNVSATASNSTLTVPFGVSLSGAKFGYICGPG